MTRYSLLIFLFLWSCDSADTVPTSPKLNLDAMVSLGDQGDVGQNQNTDMIVNRTSCQYRFVYHLPQGMNAPTEIKLAGSFEVSPWQAALLFSPLADEPNTWVMDINLSEGEYEYKFVIDGTWIKDPENPLFTDDGLGGQNSLLMHTCPFMPTCIQDLDCGAGLFCRSYGCQEQPQTCMCADGESCDVYGNCIPKPEVECDENRPCASPLVCQNNHCEPECTSDEECSNGDKCVNLSCITPQCQSDQECDIKSEVCTQYLCVSKPCDLIYFEYQPEVDDWDSIHLSGSFNGWAETITDGGWAMIKNAQGLYQYRAELENNTYEYKIVLTKNGQKTWITDPNQPEQVPDSFNGFNSLLSVNCEDDSGSLCGPVDEFQWEDAIMYFVMTDRFFNSDQRAEPVANATGGNALLGASGQYEGGDLQGVTQKIPYLSTLGINSIWLSAPYENRNSAGRAIDPNSDPHVYSAYHGYWPSPANINYNDPDRPNPMPMVESKIGTSEDLESLISNAHAQNIKILFDYVMKHVDIESGLYQAHPDWFARRNGNFALCGPENLWDDPYWGTRCSFTDYLPSFDYENIDARRWSIQDALWWAKRYGIDGFRLDAIKHVPMSWLEDLRRALQQNFNNPAGGRFYLVGETFAYDNAELLKSFVNPQSKLDGQFDFPLKARLCEAVFRNDGNLQNLANWMNQNDGFYGENALMSTWIGNHDIPRAIHFASGQISDCRQGSYPGNGWSSDFSQPQDARPYEKLFLAFAILLTNHGVPLIYYGDEIGLAGGGDPDNRRLMPWDDAQLNPHQILLRENISKLNAIRNQNKVLSRGKRINISSNQDTWVYRLTGCGNASKDITIAINKSDEARNINIPAGNYMDLWTDEMSTGGNRSLSPRSVLILRNEF